MQGWDVASKAPKTKPYRARQSYLEKSTTIDVYCVETVNAVQVIEELDVVSEDIEEWMKRCEGVQGLIAHLRTQIEVSVHSECWPTNRSGTRMARRRNVCTL